MNFYKTFEKRKSRLMDQARMKNSYNVLKII